MGQKAFKHALKWFEKSKALYPLSGKCLKFDFHFFDLKFSKFLDIDQLIRQATSFYPFDRL